MGYAADRINTVVRANWSPLDDRWYQPALGLKSDSGVAVTADTVMLCDVVLAAIRFKADAVAVCSPQVFRRTGKDQKDREQQASHRSQQTLRNPNAWQTGFEWTHLNVARLSIYGDAYNKLVPGPRSFHDELRPLHPSCVQIIEQRSDGGLVYLYTHPRTREEDRIQQEDMLHYHGLSMDGFRGLELYRLMGNVVGIALAAEKHSSIFLKKGTRVSGILSTEMPLTADVKKNTRESWQQAFGGVDAQHSGGVAVMGDGLKFTPMAPNHREAQFIELNNHIVEKLLRFLGVPGIVVGYQGDKASTYASADAFFEKGGIKHCILPLVTSMEQRDDKVLLLDDPDYFVKRNLGVLERANTQDSFKMLREAAGGPIITRNEARAILDINRDADPDMDKVLQPVNMSPGAPDKPEPEPAPPTMAPPPKPVVEDAEDAEAVTPAAPLAQVNGNDELLAVVGARLRRRIEKDAARTIRRAAMAMRDKAPKYARNTEGWKAWVPTYFEAHAEHVVEVMEISPEAARAHCCGLAAAVLADGVGVVETWEQEVAPKLVELALGA